MRTTLDIDEKLLEEAERIAGERSPSKVVNKLLSDFVRKAKRDKLSRLLSQYELVDDWRERKAKEIQEMERNLH